MIKRIFEKIFKKKCPVCNAKVSAIDSPFNTEIDGKHYYFYSNSCKDKFEKEPEKILNRKKDRLFGFMPTEHSGVPKSCHEIKNTIKRGN